MPRHVVALIILVSLVLLGLILAFAGRPTIRIAWALLDSDLGIVAVLAAAAVALGIVFLLSSATGSSGVAP